MVKKQCLWQNPGVIDSLEAALKSDQVVVGTSDTVAGLLAPLTLAGFEALNRIKGRSEKPYLIILGDKRYLADYCQLPLSYQVEQLIARCWPGPLTLILPAKSETPKFLAPAGAIAIRIPQHQGLLALLGRMGGLFSTSANLTGCPVPETVDQIDEQILQQVAFVVTDSGGPSTTPSTILDCTGKQIKLVRRGAYSCAELEKIVDILSL